MGKGYTFIALLAGGFAVACFGIGLVISAFIKGKPTKAGRVRAVIGGVLIAACLAVCFVYLD